MALTLAPDQYLELTELIDFNAPIVRRTAQDLTSDTHFKREKVKRIYRYVRDEIPYTFTRNTQKASEVLEEQVGQCNTKTTLTIALLRAVNIPARYHCGSISKTLFRNIIPRWAYPFTPRLIPGHCWAEVYLDESWIAIENVVDLKLYEGIQRKKLGEGREESIGCGFSSEMFQEEWDGRTEVLMQDEALLVDAGTFANADVYLTQAEKFLNPVRHWIKNKWVKKIMNRNFDKLRSYKVSV